MPRQKPEPPEQPEQKSRAKLFGRPSEYDPKFCEVVDRLGSEGYSYVAMAAEIGIARETLYRWKEQHPDFRDALVRARTNGQAWWEQTGREGMKQKGFNDRVWLAFLRSMYPDDWREKVEVETKGVLTHLIKLMPQLPDDLIELGTADPYALLARLQQLPALPPGGEVAAVDPPADEDA